MLKLPALSRETCWDGLFLLPVTGFWRNTDSIQHERLACDPRTGVKKNARNGPRLLDLSFKGRFKYLRSWSIEFATLGNSFKERSMSSVSYFKVGDIFVLLKKRKNVIVNTCYKLLKIKRTITANISFLWEWALVLQKGSGCEAAGRAGAGLTPKSIGWWVDTQSVLGFPLPGLCLRTSFLSVSCRRVYVNAKWKYD